MNEKIDISSVAMASAGVVGVGGGADASAIRRLPLRVNFAWTLVGNLVYSACQWAIVVVLAKVGNPQMVGEFALALAITAPIMIGFGLDLRSVLATDARWDFGFWDYFTLRLLAVTVAVFVVGVVVNAAGYSRYLAAVVFVVGCAKAFECMSDIVYGLLQRNERMDRIAVSMMIKGPLTLLAVAATVWIKKDLFLAVMFMAGGWAMMLFLFDFPNGWKALGESQGSGSVLAKLTQTSARRLWSLALLAAPVGFVMGLASFNTGIPRYFIEKHIGAHDLGIFAAMAYPMVACNTIVCALGQSAVARLAAYYAEDDCAHFVRLLWRLLVIGLVMGAAVVAVIATAGDVILRILYRPEYTGYGSVFLLLGISAALTFLSTLLGGAMCAARHFRSQLPVFSVVTLVMGLGCYCLIPKYGLTGAATACVLASAAQMIGSACVVLFAIKRRETKV